MGKLTVIVKAADTESSVVAAANFVHLLRRLGCDPAVAPEHQLALRSLGGDEWSAGNLLAEYLKDGEAEVVIGKPDKVLVGVLNVLTEAQESALESIIDTLVERDNGATSEAVEKAVNALIALRDQLVGP